MYLHIFNILGILDFQCMKQFDLIVSFFVLYTFQQTPDKQSLANKISMQTNGHICTYIHT